MSDSYEVNTLDRDVYETVRMVPFSLCTGPSLPATRSA
jgi:hypothetical protein